MSQKPNDNPNDNGIDGSQDFIQAGRATIVDQEDNFDDASDTNDNPNGAESGGGENERLFAGTYKSVADLEAGYKSLQAEYTKQRQSIASAAQPGTPNTAASEPTDVEFLRNEVEKIKIDREWAALETEFGQGMRAKIREHFDTLSEDDQHELNTMAGARIIAKMLASTGKRAPSGTQSVGSPRSHNRATSKLTRQQIVNMSPAEYKSRQPEIQQFYAEKYS